MPLYEYQCGECGKKFESYQRLSEVKDEQECPACGGRSQKMGISLSSSVKPASTGGSSCGGGSRRSPFS